MYHVSYTISSKTKEISPTLKGKSKYIRDVFNAHIVTWSPGTAPWSEFLRTKTSCVSGSLTLWSPYASASAKAKKKLQNWEVMNLVSLKNEKSTRWPCHRWLPCQGFQWNPSPSTRWRTSPSLDTAPWLPRRLSAGFEPGLVIQKDIWWETFGDQKCLCRFFPCQKLKPKMGRWQLIHSATDSQILFGDHWPDTDQFAPGSPQQKKVFEADCGLQKPTALQMPFRTVTSTICLHMWQQKRSGKRGRCSEREVVVLVYLNNIWSKRMQNACFLILEMWRWSLATATNAFRNLTAD